MAVTNLEFVNEHRIIAGKSFIMCHCTNIWVERMKLVTLAAVPYILPLVHTELRNARYKFIC